MANEKNPYLIEYTVGLNYITPAARQKIGMAGNHNAVEVNFIVDSALREAMSEHAGSENVFFRFEIYNAAGELFRTESQNVAETNHDDYVFYYALQERDTQYGGIVKVVLVLTAFDGEEVVKEVFCRPALLLPEGAPHGTNRYSYTELELKALNAADIAATAAENADKASAAALAVKKAYDSGELTGEQGPQGLQGPQGIPGEKGEKGDKGDSYILTDADKDEIARNVFLPTVTVENGTLVLSSTGISPEVEIINGTLKLK